MADPELACFVERLMLEEIAPLTSAPPGFDVQGYVQALLQ
jgi:mannitol-1-phosphate/altronate dehydrogenase